MKLFDIAIKDIQRSLTNRFFLVFGLGVPLLTVVLFHLAFGGLGAQNNFDLPSVSIQLVNQDLPSAAYGGFSAGQLIADILQSDDLAELLQVTEAQNPASARSAVDDQQANVAVIIPERFSSEIFLPQGPSTIELYHDPTLTLGPSIVKGILEGVLNGFSGTQIATQVVAQSLIDHGLISDSATLEEIALQYATWSIGIGQRQQQGDHPLLDLRSPVDQEADRSIVLQFLSLIMAGMMVFYVFFTGAASAMSILQEEESGTLPRLFTTPTPQSAILAGKMASVYIVLVLQVTFLVTISWLVFGIHWGETAALVAVSLGVILSAASFGIFVTSMLKDTRQTGIVYGGVMTVLGMIGMLGVFTANVPSASATARTVALFTPQGWGVTCFQMLLEGAVLPDLRSHVLVMLALAAAFFVIGLIRFRRRFA